MNDALHTHTHTHTMTHSSLALVLPCLFSSRPPPALSRWFSSPFVLCKRHAVQEHRSPYLPLSSPLNSSLLASFPPSLRCSQSGSSASLFVFAFPSLPLADSCSLSRFYLFTFSPPSWSESEERELRLRHLMRTIKIM